MWRKNIRKLKRQEGGHPFSWHTCNNKGFTSLKSRPFHCGVALIIRKLLFILSQNQLSWNFHHCL